jgi:hypothetical protein
MGSAAAAHRSPLLLSFPSFSSTPKLRCFSSAIMPCSSSLVGDDTGTVSPWMAVCTFFSLAPFSTRTMSAMMPPWIAIT